MAELKRKADFASLFGVEAHYMSTPEIAERWPFMNADGVLGGIHMPSDGSANPIDLTMALAKGARMHGATLREHIKVEEVLVEGGKARGVRTDHGTVTADVVVNCGGMWARELDQQNGVGVPLHACEHYYLVTEAIKDYPATCRSCDPIATALIGRKTPENYYLGLRIFTPNHGQQVGFPKPSNSTACPL